MSQLERDLSAIRAFSEGEFEIDGTMPSMTVARNASKFVQALERFDDKPEVSSDPQGNIEFEWFRDHDHTILVNLGESEVAWSARINGTNDTGSEELTGTMPSKLLALLEEY